MALNPSFPGPSSVTSQTALRKDLAGLILRDSAGAPRGGVFPRSISSLVTSRGDMKLNVAAFEGVSVRGGGPLFMANDGTAQTPTLPIPVANSQISVIYFKQNEATPFTDSDNLPIFGVETGLAAAIPTKPSIAGIAGAEELATVTIPSTATATNSAGVVIAQTYEYTTTSGGVLWVRNSAERDALLSPVLGQVCYRLDKLWAETYVASGTWRAEPGAQHVEFTSTVAASNATPFALGTLTVDSANSTDTTFATAIANGIRLQPGIYAIHVVGGLTAAATGRSYVGIENFAGTMDYARYSIAVGEDVFSVSTPNLRIGAVNTDLALTLYQTTGGSRTITARIRVTKVF